MAGEVSGLIYAALVAFIAIIAFAGVMTSVSTNYSVNSTADVQNFVNVANSSIQTISNFTGSSAQNITNTALPSGVTFLWMTPGSLLVLVNMLTSIPGVMYNLLIVTINAVAVPLGVSPVLTTMVINIFGIAVLLFVMFAVLYALLKVQL